MWTAAVRCVGFTRLERGSLLGFADLEMDSGMVLLGCTFHASNGNRWCNPPGRPQLDSGRKPIVGGDGKIVYAACVQFVDAKTRFRWSAEAVAAIEAHLKSNAPARAGAMNSGERSETASQGARDG